MCRVNREGFAPLACLTPSAADSGAGMGCGSTLRGGVSAFQASNCVRLFPQHTWVRR